jgi:hypothetical protein
MGDLTAIGETRDDDGSGLTLSVGLETARRRTQTLFFSNLGLARISLLE